MGEVSNHSRNRSFFGSGSNPLLFSSSKTYGKKRSKGHKPALTQSHIEQQLWTKPESTTGTKSRDRASSVSVVANPGDAEHKSSHNSNRSVSGPLVGLGVLDFESTNDSSWESETTQVLKEVVSRPRPLSVASSFSVNTTASEKSTKSNNNGRLSRVARALSNMSLSSNSTVEGNPVAASKHTSMASTVSTLNNRSSFLGIVSVGESNEQSLQDRRNSARKSLSILTQQPNNDGVSESSNDQFEHDKIAAAESVNDTPKLVNDQQYSQHVPPTTQEVEALDIPRVPCSDYSNPAYSPASTAPSLQSKDSSRYDPSMSSPSAPSFLSYKKSGSELRHKRVNKTAISGPTGMADSSEYFADSASVTSTTASSTRSTRRRSGHKNGSSIFSSISSSSMLFVPKEQQPTTKSPQLSSHAAPVKKSSFADIKRSIMSFSASSTNLFRHVSSSSKSSHHQQSEDKPMISLPTPIDTSREKLRNKLRASNSLMSLARSDTSDSLVAVPMAQHVQSQLDTLLGLCNSSSICDFDSYIRDVTRSADMAKLAEASFSEVYLQDDPHTGTSKVYKIIPFGNEELELLPVQDIIQELSIARLLMSLDGFVDVIDAAVVRGKYPQYLVDRWDDFANTKESENYRPDYFPDDQLYCIMVLSNAGTDLEHFPVASWLEAETIFWQTVHCLAVAEQRYQFEHRDLHWGNLVISVPKHDNTGHGPNNNDESTLGMENLDINDYDYDHNDLRVTLIDYTLSRATNLDGTIIYTRLDHPDFFRGKGDYQFDIYRFMRSHIAASSAPGTPNSKGTNGKVNGTPLMNHANASTSSLQVNKDIDWAAFTSKTNVMWLHYVCDKLVTAKGLEKVVSTKSGRLSIGGSNGSLRAAYKNGESVMSEEARACKAMELVHRTIDPRKKVFSKKNGQASFADFDSAKDFFLWAKDNKLIPRHVLTSLINTLL